MSAEAGQAAVKTGSQMTIVLHPRIDLLDGGRQSLLFEAGERSVVKKRQRVLPWWVQTPDGKYVLFIRSRWKAVEFEKGKAAIAVSSLEKLPSIMDTVIAAVRSGSWRKRVRR
jgi:hypothetical protein